MFLYDAWQSYYSAGDFDLFSLDDVDAAIERIHTVKYQQTITPKGRGSGLQLTALPAGYEDTCFSDASLFNPFFAKLAPQGKSGEPLKEESG